MKPSRASPLDRPGTAGVKGDGGGVSLQRFCERMASADGWMSLSSRTACLSSAGVAIAVRN